MIGPETIEGYTLVGKRHDLSAHVFVQRWAAKPSTWLRFLRKIEGKGYWVTAHKSLRDAKAV